MENASKWNNGRLRERALPNVFWPFENWFILTDPTNPMYSQPMDEEWKVSFVRNPLVHSWEQKLFVNMDKNTICTRHSYVSSKLPFLFNTTATILKNGVNLKGKEHGFFFLFLSPSTFFKLDFSLSPKYTTILTCEMLWQNRMECFYKDNVKKGGTFSFILHPRMAVVFPSPWRRS